MRQEDKINELIKQEGVDTNLISDGYHTFGELYEHRCRLFIALCHQMFLEAWKSKKHSDGSEWDGWFVAGIHPTGRSAPITYHLPISMWNDLKVDPVDKAPEWDGHTPADVLERLKKL